MTSFIVGSIEVVYWIKCTSCNDGFEMRASDYAIMKPLMKLNYKFKTGKIDDVKYQSKNSKIMMSIAKKK